MPISTKANLTSSLTTAPTLGLSSTILTITKSIVMPAASIRTGKFFRNLSIKFLLGLFVFLGMSVQSQAQLASWSQTWSGIAASPLAASSLGTNVASGSLARVNLVGGSSSTRYSSSAWNSTSNYLTVTITPSSGYKLYMNSQTVAIAMGSSGTGPSGYTLYSSVDSYAASLGTLNTSCSGQQANTITLPSTGFNGLSTITFRIVGVQSGCSSTLASGGTGGPSSIVISGSSIAAPTVTTGTLPGSTATSISLQGTVNANGNPSTPQFKYGTTNAYGLTVAATPATVTGTSATAISATVSSGLSPNVTYHYAASASNAAGTTDGSDQTVVTLANVPSAPTVNGATSNTLNVTINVNGNPANTEFAIVETTTSKFLKADGTLTSIPPVWQTATAWGTKTVTGLTASTSYTFLVFARNSDNNSTGSSPAGTASTLAASTAPVLTTNPSPASLTDVSAVLGGNVSSDGGSALTDNGVVYAPTSVNPSPVIGGPGVSQSSVATVTPPANFSANAISLTPNTQYSDAAYASNAVGTTYGSTVTFYTNASVPAAPTVSATSASVINVKVTAGANPASTEYAIKENGGQYVQAAGTLAATAVWQTAAVWNNSGAGTNVTGLTASTSYTFAVKARNSINVETAFGSTASATTLAPPPANVHNVSQGLGAGAYYVTIQAAIDAAASGDSIHVIAGTYNESPNVNKSLKISGANKGIAGNGSRVAESIIDGNAGARSGFAITANNVTIDGFKVQGCHGTYEAGIYTGPSTSGYLIENNILTNNDKGVYALSNGPSRVINNLFDGNNLLAPGGSPYPAGGVSLYTYASNGLVVDNNEFKNNTLNSAANFDGGAANAHSNVTFSHNNIHDNNTASSMVYMGGVSNGSLSYNSISGGNRAFKVAGADNNIVMTNNLLTGNVQADIMVANDGLGTNSATQAHNNSLTSATAILNPDGSAVNATCNWYGSAVQATIVTKLSGSNITYAPWLNLGTDNNGAAVGWEPVIGAGCVSNVHNVTQNTYYATIQNAIDAANANDSIHVEAGTYSELLSINKSLHFSGNNAGTCGTATRTTETVLTAPTSGSLINLSGAVTVNFDGFNIVGQNVGNIAAANQNLTLTNNLVQLNFVPASNNLYFASNTLTLTCNSFKAMSGTNDGSSSHIFFAGNAMNATNNRFTSADAIPSISASTTSLPVWVNVTTNANNVNISNNLFTQIDLGILLADNAGNVNIHHNEFDQAKRESYPFGSGKGAGIAIFGDYNPANPSTIRYNKFYNSETGIRTSGPGTNFPDSSKLTIRYNSFENLINEGINIAGSYSGSTQKLDALCNWFGNTTGPNISTNNGTTFPANQKILDAGNKVKYKNWLIYADNDNAALGVQLPTNIPVAPGSNASQAENHYRILSNALGCVVSGQTVTLSGTFDFSNATAQAEWAKGNDGIVTAAKTAAYNGSGDEYAIILPDTANNVTITAASLGAATIQGPGDLANVSLETPLFINSNKAGSSYKNLTITNLTIRDFDMSIIADHNGGPSNVMDNYTVRNNTFYIPADLNKTAAPGDDLQNIGLHLNYGKNETVENNTFYIDGTGVTAGASTSTTVAIQSATSGGDVYDGLKIRNNNFHVTGLPNAQPAQIVGIWENSNSQTANVELSGNTFVNDNAGNLAANNKQLAFRVTSFSGDATHQVVYANNEISGFNRGISFIGDPFSSYGPNTYFGGENPVIIRNNKIDKYKVGVSVKKDPASANSGSPALINNNSFTNVVAGGFAIQNESTGTTGATCNWYDTTLVANIISGDVSFIPRLANGTDDQPGTVGFQTSASCIGPVLNVRNGNIYNTIQSAIDAATTINGDSIRVSPGIYPENVTVNKSLTIFGTDSSLVIVDKGDANYGTGGGYGFDISASNVTLRKMKVRNYKSGVWLSADVNNIKLDSMTLIENFEAGFYSRSSTDSLVIKNSTLSWNGNKGGVIAGNSIKRGIFTQGLGFPGGATNSRFYVQNNLVEYNGLTGIDINSNNSLSGLVIEGNTSRYNIDEQIGIWLGNSNETMRAVSVKNNTLVLNNKDAYGLEMRMPHGSGLESGTGSVVIEGNNISVVSHTGTANGKDMVAIGIIRRKDGQTGIIANDQSQGVIIKNNTITGFVNAATPTSGSAFGIVVGGIGHRIYGNTISGTQVPIQLQQGNENAGNDNNATVPAIPNNEYFDRDNSSVVCAELGANSITGAAPRLVTGPSTVSGTLPPQNVTNTTTLVKFCTIQSAINYPSTVNGNTITAAAATYPENVTVSKSLTILGANQAVNPNTGVRGAESIVVPAVNNVTDGRVFNVTADNVTIKGFTINGDNTNISGGTALNGADVNATTGIGTGVYNVTDGRANLLIENNILTNFDNNVSSTGAIYGNGSQTGAITGGVIRNNKIDNSNIWAILTEANYYSTVDGNVITKANRGIQVDGNWYDAGSPTRISNNNIKYYKRGITLNNSFGNASQFVASNNTIAPETNGLNEDGGTGAATVNRGITVWSMYSSTGGAALSANKVTGAHYGMELWNISPNKLTSTGDTVQNSTNVGIYIPTSQATYGSASFGATAVSITTATVTGSVNNGIQLTDNDGTNGIPAKLSLTNSYVTGGVNNISIAGAEIDAASLINNNALTGSTAKAIDASAYTGATAIAATCNWYGSNVGAYVTSKIAGNVNYIPVLNSGADASPAAGFQPSGTCAAITTSLYVNDNVTTGDVYTTAVGNDANVGTPASPLRTLSYAVSIAQAGDTIYVDAGNYPTPSSIVIDKPLTIKGSNYGIAGTGGGTRNTEAIIDFTTNPGSAQHITITSPTKVTIDGLNIQDNLLIIGTSLDRRALVLQNSNDHVITNNIFYRESGGANAVQKASEMMAIYVNFPAPGTTATISNNYFTGAATGLFDNRSWRRGIWKQGGTGTTNITNNTFDNSRAHINLEDDLSGVVITGNNFNLGSSGIASINIGGAPLLTGTYTFGANNNFTGFGTYIKIASSAAGYVVDAQACKQNGNLFSSLSLADEFTLDAFLEHGPGLVRAKAGNVYAILSSPFSAGKGSIQTMIDRAITNDVVNVMTGTFNGDVNINKSVTVLGQSRGAIIRGLYAGSSKSVIVNANNVTIKNVTITRDYGVDFAAWAASTKTEGLDVENVTGFTADGITVRDNRNGVLLHNVPGFVFKNSIVRDNRTGFQVFGDLSNGKVLNNFITNNFTHGFLINSDQFITTIGTNLTVNNNNISGNWYSQLNFQNNTSTPGTYVGDLTGMNFNCNWYGTLFPDYSTAPAGGVGYATQNPSQFGGTDPNVNADIRGTEAAYFTYKPYLLNGTDTDADSLSGFQPVPTCAQPDTKLYVNDNSTTGDHYTTAVGNDNNFGTPAAPFATLSHAISVANVGDTIYVDAGNYVDTTTAISIVVTKRLNIFGSNFNSNPASWAFAPSTFYPNVSNPDPNTGSAMLYINAAASGTKIDGITFDGDNPALTGGVAMNGANVDAEEAIASYDGVSNVSIQHNKIKNITYAGVDLYNYYNAGAATSGNSISNNSFDNINGTGYGIAVLIYNNAYTNITNNTMTRVSLGVQTGNFSQPDPGTSHDISSNTIQSQAIGIWTNLHYTGAATFNVANNTITNFAGATNSMGIRVQSIQSAVGVNLTNNNVTGNKYGVALMNDPTTNTITVTGGTLSGNQVGVWATNSLNGNNMNADASRYKVSGVSIQNATYAGIEVSDTSLTTGTHNAVALDITGNTIINNTTRGLLIQGGTASATFSGGTPAAFTNQSVYIDQISNGTTKPTANINATAVTFDGTTGAGKSLADNFATEDKINHKVDDGGLGFVLVKASNTFVTTNSFIAPTTTTAKIQRGVDAADPTGFTVNVSAGTFADNVNVNKEVIILGADTATTVVNSALGNVSNPIFDINANNVTISKLHAQGAVGSSLTRGFYVNTTRTNLTLDNIKASLHQYSVYADNAADLTGLTISNSSFQASGAGVQVGVSGKVNNLTVTNSLFHSNQYGLASNADNAITNNQTGLNNVSVTGSTFYGNTIKGMYFEKLNNAVLNNNTVNNNATVANGFSTTGIDVNLKYGTYTNITINGNRMNTNGTGTAALGGGAIAVKARNDAPNYNTNTASLAGLRVTNNEINIAPVGISIGNNIDRTTARIDSNIVAGTSVGITSYGATSGAITQAHKNSIDASVYTVANGDASPTSIDATCNWHGGFAGGYIASKVSGTVTYDPALNSGTDAQPGTVGFQPAGTCATAIKALYVNDNVSDGSNTYTTAVGNNANLGTPASPLRTITYALSIAQPGDTIYVDGGIYVENPNITKPVTIYGANKGVAGSGVRPNNETVVQTDGNKTSVFTITGASNVVINGLTVEGDDPSVTGGPTASGNDANVSYGFRPTGTLNNDTIVNNIIKHVAIGFRGDGTSAGNLIASNWFDAVGNYDFGYAVSLRTNFYADVKNNKMTRVWTGLHTNNFFGAGPATWSFTGNEVHSYAAGLWYNLQYNGATGLTVNNNQISAEATAVAHNYGILMSSIQDAVNPSFTNNTITGTANGIAMTNTSTSNTITLGATNTITGTKDAAILFSNDIDQNFANPIGTTVFGPAPAAATVKVDGIAITAASGNGIQVNGYNNAGQGVYSLNVSAATTVNAGANGLVMSGANVAVTGNTINNLSFVGQTANYIQLSNNALSGQTITATASTFDGTTGAAKTLANNYATEDKIVHAIDNGALGFVLVKANNTFVTTNSFIAPATTTAKIQRGVDAASNGFTVNVTAGSFADNVNVNKQVTIIGDGSTTTVVNSVAGNSGNIFTIAADNVTIKKLHAQGVPVGGSSASRGIYFNSTVSNTTLNNVQTSLHQYGVYVDNAGVVTNLAIDSSSFSASGNGMEVEASGKVTTLSIKNSAFNNNLYGLSSNVAAGSTGNSTSLTNVTIANSTFNNNTTKGLYFEKLNNATFDSITVTGNGNGAGAQLGGFDINLKGGTYSNVTIRQSTIANNGNGNPDGAGLFIKGRSTGSAAANPATLSNVTITNNYITNNGSGAYGAGIRIGESTGTLTGTENEPTNIQIHNNSITGNTTHAIRNATNATTGSTTLDASCNWFGSAASQDVAAANSGVVPYTSWLTNGTDVQPTVAGFQPSPTACNGTPIVITLVSITKPCYGTNNGAIDINVTGGTSPYTYVWTPGGAVTQDITGVTDGTYKVVVTDANGSKDSLTVIVTQYAPITNYAMTPAGVGNTPVCSGSTITIGLAGSDLGVSYQLKFNGANQGAPVNGTGSPFNFGTFGTAGIYTVLATNVATGCDSTLTDNVTIHSTPRPTGIISGSTAICLTGSTPLSIAVTGTGTFNGTINVSTGGTISFSGTGPTITVNVSPTVATTYTLATLSDDSCTAQGGDLSGSAVITVNPRPSVSITGHTNVLCYGSASGSFTYSYTGGAGNGAYNVIIKNITANTTVYSASIPFDTYSATQNTLGAATYRIYVYNKFGCVDSASVTITQPAAALAIPATKTDVTCAGGANSGSITFGVNGGTAPYNVSVTNTGTSFVAPAAFSNFTINGLAAGTYTINVTDGNGCTQANTLTILTPTLSVTATISGTASVCAGSSPAPNITFNASGGTAPYTFTYRINAGGNLTVTSPGVISTATVAASTASVGTFTYTLLSVTDANGTPCSQSAGGSATITVNNCGLPDLITGFQTTGSTYSTGTPSRDVAVRITNAGSGATTAPFVFNVVKPSSLAFSTAIDVNASGPNGGGVTISNSSFTIVDNGTFYQFTSKPGVVLNASSAIRVGFTVTKVGGVGSSGTITSVIAPGTGGGETPTTNNSATTSLSIN